MQKIFIILNFYRNQLKIMSDKNATRRNDTNHSIASSHTNPETEQTSQLKSKPAPPYSIGGDDLPSDSSDPGSSNNTGLPNNLKSGMEAVGGVDLSDTKVHYNSKKPSEFNALAYTKGTDIFVGSGQEKHLAHEAAHVVQQKKGQVSPTSQINGQGVNNDTALEKEADVMGEKATQLKKGGSSTNKVLKNSNSSAPIQMVPDLHGNSQIPDQDSQDRLKQQLDPDRASAPPSGGGPVVIQEWDGASSGGVVSADAQRNREALKTELTAALQAHLNRVMPDIRATASGDRVDINELVGAGNAAKAKVDAKYGAYTSSAAGPPPNFTFAGTGPNQTLFDAYDPAQRAAVGVEIDPKDLTDWMASTDSDARAAQNAHNFSQDADGEQEDYFKNEILAPFVSANDADLRLYDTFGFALSPEAGIVVPTSVNENFDNTSDGSTPSLAVRATQWDSFRILTHEYIHQLEHENIHHARQEGSFNSRIIGEGFCELFTKEILTEVLPTAHTDSSLIREVEGDVYDPPTTAAMVGTFNAGSYADYLANAENIEAEIGSEAIRAAYFQGHVEYLGIDPEGEYITPQNGNVVQIPEGIETVPDLAIASGVDADTIRTLNNIEGDQINMMIVALTLPGCSNHTVVTGHDSGKTETITDIANQHGISEHRLQLANPLTDFTNLSTGQNVFIPVH